MPLLTSYLARLASKEFAEWAIFEILEAIVKSTETKHDDKWLNKFRQIQPK